MKLFTIGDSISQGFRSLAAAQADQCFSTLVARVLGDAQYRFPTWDHYGLPVNLEAILRRMESRYGSNINAIEWLTVLATLNGVLDEAEEYYERGQGNEHVPDASAPLRWSNVAFYGATVADAWQLTPEVCLQAIARENAKTGGDNLLQGPNAPFFRSALRMLNPKLDPARMQHSQITLLNEAATQEGIENLVIWLGANNCLGTVIDLQIRQTPNVPARRPHTLSYFERESYKWNLWHPDDFAAEYKEFVSQVKKALTGNKSGPCNVFVATVPLVTIAPIAKGVGETTSIKRDASDPASPEDVYYKYYTYFPFDEDFARKTSVQLSLSDAVHIDRCIRRYNQTIVTEAAAAGFHVVDIAGALDAMAWKRNAGNPTYKFPPYFDYIYPKVDTKYYHADEEGRLRQGGIFSLDGVHPTAVGHGIMAWEFLKAMNKVGVPGANPAALSWSDIFRSDSLYSSPIRVMHEIYGHSALAQHLVKLVKAFRT